ncbi:collagen-binding domain-containing protein [Nocardioides sp. zg-DK7169]|uniref:collagen-binding domain-containing protein n=1 Tax=Nocardioides sp. zg-DK7169 TaxID=2736600 RepID=UPI001C1308DE|nr:collagen-binding domain-containing protein [Nocardioides sp. zg-DK7169]
MSLHLSESISSVPRPRVRARTGRRALGAAVALVLGAATLSVAASGGAAAATTPCAPVTHPLGLATGWTEFVEGNGHRTSESEGSVAYGGDLLTPMTVGGDLTVSPSTPTLVVAGRHGEWFNLQRGSAFVTPRSGVNLNGGGSYLSANPVDFAAAFTHLRATSTAWGAAPQSGTLVRDGDTQNRVLVLRGTDTALNVFHLDQALLDEARTISYDVPPGAAVLVNVAGTSVRIDGDKKMTLTPDGAQPTTAGVRARGPFLWNFPEATSLRIRVGSDFGGHLIAPRAAVRVDLGVIVGQVVAASFHSDNETHAAFVPASVCLPAPPLDPEDPEVPEPPKRSDVTVTKTASAASVPGGSTLVYRLRATNLGAAPATGVVVTDRLPGGVTFVSASAPCTHAGGTVTCAVGTLAPSASRELEVRVLVAPIAGAGRPSHPQAYHSLTPYKVEQHVDLEPGQTRSVRVDCGPGDLVSDGALRTDHVDQGTGTLADVRILTSHAVDARTWKVVARNHATGRAQAKAYAVCLPGHTEVADRQTGHGDGHRHPLELDAEPVTATVAYGPGTHLQTLTCPTGSRPVAPGHAVAGGRATLVSSATGTGRSRTWTFGVRVDDPATVTFSVSCLRTTTGAVQGHTHELHLTHVVREVVLRPDTVTEEQVTCPDDAKGIVATFDLPDGVHPLGHDPRLKARAFRLLTAPGPSRTAVLDLLCLGDRTSTEATGTGSPVTLDNTAAVTSSSVDADPGNNSATATVVVTPGAVTAALLPAGQVVGRQVRLRVVSSVPTRGRVAVRAANGRVLARGTRVLKAATPTTVTLRLTRPGVRQLGSLRGQRTRQVTVVVRPRAGRNQTRTVTVRR